MATKPVSHRLGPVVIRELLNSETGQVVVIGVQSRLICAPDTNYHFPSVNVSLELTFSGVFAA